MPSLPDCYKINLMSVGEIVKGDKMRKLLSQCSVIVRDLSFEEEKNASTGFYDLCINGDIVFLHVHPFNFQNHDDEEYIHVCSKKDVLNFEKTSLKTNTVHVTRMTGII